MSEATKKISAILVTAYDSTPVDKTDAMVDILTDLRLYCEANDIDFHAIMDTSYMHYLEERKRLGGVKHEATD